MNYEGKMVGEMNAAIHVAVAVAAMLALASCDRTEQADAPDRQDQPAAISSVGADRNEIASAKGEGPYVGAVLAVSEIPTLVEYYVVDGEAVTGGDMIVGTHQQLQAQARQFLGLVDLNALSPEQRALADQARASLDVGEQRAAATKSLVSVARTVGWGTLGALWPTRVVPYEIHTSIPEGTRRDNIGTAIANWNAQAPIRLRLRSEMTPEEIGDTATLRFRDHSDPDTEFACSSWVGYMPTNGVQRISLNPTCSAGNIMHEIGHALGFHHEHQRTDREGMFTTNINMPNDPTNYGELAGRELSAHDLCSLMHYSPNTTSSAWFTLTQAGTQSFAACRTALPQNCQRIGQRCRLSAADRTSLAAMYPAQP